MNQFKKFEEEDNYYDDDFGPDISNSGGTKKVILNIFNVKYLTTLYNLTK